VAQPVRSPGGSGLELYLQLQRRRRLRLQEQVPHGIYGRLEFRFPHVGDEQACLVRLADWLEEDEENVTVLAEWMQRVERAYVSDPLMRISAK